MNPTIPAGFKPVDTETSSWGNEGKAPTTENVNNGLVIEDGSGNQFVWIPVETVIASSETEGNTNKAMAIQQTDGNYRGLLYNFTSSGSTVISECTTTTSSNREPDIVSDYDNDISYNNGLFTKDSLQEEYNKMMISVEKYHGFYVGRYELGLDTNDNPTSRKAENGLTTADSGILETRMWYGLYKKCKEFALEESNKSVVSSMMWGSQYDAMMNWMQINGIVVTHTPDGINTIKNSNTTTGSESKDILKNIFDLYGCHYEWTLEAYSTGNRFLRGGYCRAGGTYSPDYRRISSDPPDTDYYDSTRITLYIKTT